MKLHVGCGAVFLRDWTNVDLPLPHVFLAKDRPDLVERFITTEEDYYGRHKDKNVDKVRKVALTRDSVCDVYGSFAFLPSQDGMVSEVLARQVFEHLHMDQARAALQEAHRVMHVGGMLRIDVPDPDETLRKYKDTGDEFYIRHLFGPRRDMYGFHTHFTRSMLMELAATAGFEYVQEETNVHWYPAYTLRFERL